MASSETLIKVLVAEGRDLLFIVLWKLSAAVPREEGKSGVSPFAARKYTEV